VWNWLNEQRKTKPADCRSGWAHWIGRGWAQLSYALTIEPTWLELNHIEVAIPDWPTRLAGLRVVHLSDLHCSKTVSPAYLSQSIALAQQQSGHLIAVTGDFIHSGFEHIDEVARLVGQLRAPLGVYAVLGNHDYSVRYAFGRRRWKHLHLAMTEALVHHGVRVLNNETLLLAEHEARLYLTGVGDLWSQDCDPDKALAGLDPAIPRVVMAHNPCTIELLGSHRCDLMLSGHTHGGQVSLPRLGPIGLGRQGRRYAAGLYPLRQGHLYVNKGIGFGSVPIRYNVRPEVAVLTLQPA
jgi:predicted MPP superfamily phosphohydrolase